MLKTRYTRKDMDLAEKIGDAIEKTVNGIEGAVIAELPTKKGEMVPVIGHKTEGGNIAVLLVAMCVGIQRNIIEPFNDTVN